MAEFSRSKTTIKTKESSIENGRVGGFTHNVGVKPPNVGANPQNGTQLREKEKKRLGFSKHNLTYPEINKREP